MVGLVIVSHSELIAKGVMELCRQMAPNVPMAAAGGLPLPIGALAGEITRRLLALVENTSPDFPGGLEGAACLSYYRAHSLLTGRRVLCTRGDEQFCAVAEGVDDAFRLILRMEDGFRRLLDSGEASVRAD